MMVFTTQMRAIILAQRSAFKRISTAICFNNTSSQISRIKMVSKKEHFVLGLFITLSIFASSRSFVFAASQSAGGNSSPSDWVHFNPKKFEPAWKLVPAAWLFESRLNLTRLDCKVLTHREVRHGNRLVIPDRMHSGESGTFHTLAPVRA